LKCINNDERNVVAIVSFHKKASMNKFTVGENAGAMGLMTPFCFRNVKYREIFKTFEREVTDV